ncbi:MAG: alpha-amylase family glycosyl hydrolase [Polyangiaceae bacterium]
MLFRPRTHSALSRTLVSAALTLGGCDSGDTDSPPTGAATSSSGGTMTTGSSMGGAGGMGGMAPYDGVPKKPVIYPRVVRLFGNTNETRTKDGTLAENGSGKFADIDDKALGALADMGVTHVWLTGVLRQATLTDYTSSGLPADDADTVKGRAGSFYAVRDYYDVSPDYALDPPKRLDEFDALVKRIHDRGLKVMIDLVPNHVARGYGSVVKPALDFGKNDDQTKFFSPQNDFFYLAEPAGQSLSLKKPTSWNPSGVTFDGKFDREDGTPGHTPRATGNNVTSPSPSETDWYETVKLNYGFNFVDNVGAYDPPPDVWTKVDAILAYWQKDHAVDGFRCDFAHYVPTEAWTYLLAKVKERDPSALVIAEAYDNLNGLIAAGFDAVYHDATYDTFKRVYLGKASQSDIDSVMGSIDDAIRGRYVQYLENHDERRIASPIVPGDSPDGTGFGSMNAGHQLAPLSYLYSNGPILMLNGQEVGEPGAGEEGFGGDDGRTTIFDYWSMPELAKWVNGHAYDGGKLSEDQKKLRAYYGDLFALAQDSRVRGNRYWGLKYFNNKAMFPDASDDMFTFARFAQKSGTLLVVAANFGIGHAATGRIRVPADLADKAGLASTAKLRVTAVLDENGKIAQVVKDAVTPDVLASEGFDATISDQSAKVFLIE